MSGFLIFVSFISFIAFIVYWRKKANARKAAGENYKSDPNYQSISKTKRIIGAVCVLSFIIGSATSGPSSEEKARIAAEQQAKAEKAQAEKEAKALERANSLTGEEKQFFDEKFNMYNMNMDEKSARAKALDDLDSMLKAKADKKAAEEKAIADAKAAEEKAAAESKQRQESMEKDLKSGWNTASTDTDSDNTNFERATDLLKKYSTEIKNMSASPADTSAAMKKPWNYYGKVVTVSGQVYFVQQLPPGHSLSKFFGQDCIHAMLKCDDGNVASIYIVGSSDNIQDGNYATFKGFIFGHVGLENTTGGGHSKGFGFTGFPQ